MVVLRKCFHCEESKVTGDIKSMAYNQATQREDFVNVVMKHSWEEHITNSALPVYWKAGS